MSFCKGNIKKGRYILIEEFFKAIFEILFYHLGKFVARILFPNINISETTQEPKPSLKIVGFTYVKGKKKYFYTTTVTFIGFLFWDVKGKMCILLIFKRRLPVTSQSKNLSGPKTIPSLLFFNKSLIRAIDSFFPSPGLFTKSDLCESKEAGVKLYYGTANP